MWHAVPHRACGVDSTAPLTATFVKVYRNQREHSSTTHAQLLHPHLLVWPRVLTCPAAVQRTRDLIPSLLAHSWPLLSRVWRGRVSAQSSLSVVTSCVACQRDVWVTRLLHSGLFPPRTCFVSSVLLPARISVLGEKNRSSVQKRLTALCTRAAPPLTRCRESKGWRSEVVPDCMKQIVFHAPA